MPFDGIFAGKMIEELRQAVLCHVDKIYQPSFDELVFLLRKKDFSARLLLCARSGAARVQFTEIKRENPESAPMFCMLARKYFSGAKLTAVEQYGNDRLVRFCFETTDEMGDRVFPQVICELMGAAANIVLVQGNGKIIDAVRRSDPATAKRLIQPGAGYEYPPSQGKVNPKTASAGEVADAVLQKGGLPLAKALLETVDGFSPLVCREIAERGFGEDILTENADRETLIAAISRWRSCADQTAPTLLLRESIPFDYSYMDIRQYGQAVHNEPCESFSRLLDRYFAERDAAEHLKRTANDVIQACGAAEARIRRRLSARQQDMKRCAEKENYRIFGELLKANLYTVRPGSRAVTVVNYYDENGGTITIPLDPKLSAVQNAAKYFKEYKKSRTALQLLEELIAEDGRELDYLASVRDSIERCETAADLREIREELQEAGYLRRSAKKTVSKIRKNIGFREFVSPGGFRLLVGRTNQQNDTLTLRVAQKNDWWFHVKGGPGSHAVLISDGNEVPQDDLLMAAQTAAWFSKSAHSSQVAVDYTRIRHVKKPKNAKPGMVIYTDQHTVFVTPKQPEEPSGGKE